MKDQVQLLAAFKTAVSIAVPLANNTTVILSGLVLSALSPSCQTLVTFTLVKGIWILVIVKLMEWSPVILVITVA